MTTRHINKAIVGLVIVTVLAHLVVSRPYHRPRFVALAGYGNGGGNGGDGGGDSSGSGSYENVSHLDHQRQDVCNELKETVKAKQKECDDLEKGGKKDTPEFKQKQEEITKCKEDIQTVAGQDVDVDGFCDDDGSS
ncbi:unnamed protein product (mitochondrion) [Plasmodiophora brassicae]|uniref:Uncharacterized protein n=1 Tax=Plasmodiophora brassicae TaxID=37360 RepID=A0A3P3YG28_PLABS|nr:unnamed protein product [Plasmodiophora brassicae]